MATGKFYCSPNPADYIAGIVSSMGEQAMPSGEEMLHGMDTLTACGNTVDYIVTHTPSGKAGGYLSGRGRPERLSGLHMYFNRIEDTVSFRRWFFGSLHIDRHLSARHEALFSDVIPVRDPKKKK